MEEIFSETSLRQKRCCKGQDTSQSSSQDQRWQIFPQIILDLELQLQSSFKSRIRIQLPLLKQGHTAFKCSTKAVRHETDLWPTLLGMTSVSEEKHLWLVLQLSHWIIMPAGKGNKEHYFIFTETDCRNPYHKSYLVLIFPKKSLWLARSLLHRWSTCLEFGIAIGFQNRLG